jgi:hypothetical protein
MSNTRNKIKPLAKELTAEIDLLDARNEELIAENDALDEDIDILNARLDTITRAVAKAASSLRRLRPRDLVCDENGNQETDRWVIEGAGGELVMCRADGGGGWSFHAPDSTDEAIATGAAEVLISGTAEWDDEVGDWDRPTKTDELEARIALVNEMWEGERKRFAAQIQAIIKLVHTSNGTASQIRDLVGPIAVGLALHASELPLHRYEVDSAMLGEGGVAELRVFCNILQALTSVEIVCVEDTYNRATNPAWDYEKREELIDAPWAKALEIWANNQD